jgi:superoxide dismutase, Cu-Zn family
MHRWLIVGIAALAVAGCSRGGGEAVAYLEARSGSQVSGTAHFKGTGGGVEVVVDAKGLPAGPHGIHIHEKGDCSASDASSAGAHFNPGGGKHGGPTDDHAHAGDLGNITGDASGNGKLTVTVEKLAISGDNGVIDKSIVIHTDPDDLKTDPSGNSGSRIGCGVIKAGE